MAHKADRFIFDEYTSRQLCGYHEDPARSTPIVDDVDVLVVGGSQSGCAAAICAARHGARVSLVERYGFLGGQSVYSSVVQWEKRAFINNLGAVASRGIAKEMLERILAKGGSDGLWDTPPGCPEMRDGEEWLNVDAIVLSLIEMCEEAGVELLFHTMAVDTIVSRHDDQPPRLKGVVFENKTGRFATTARVTVDATADLDLVWRSIGEDGCGLRDPKERIAAGFYVWFGGIDNEAFGAYLTSDLNPTDPRAYPDPRKHPDKLRRHLKEEKLVYVRNLEGIVSRARKLGLLEPVDDALAEIGAGPLSGFGMKYVGNGRWCTYFASLQGLNLLDTWQLTQYEILRIKLTSMMLPVMKLIPGWENCYIARTNLHIGGRETRYLKATRMLTGEDVFSALNGATETPPDTVGRSGAHDPGKNKLRFAYPIPYGIVVPEKLDGVLCCGRPVGAEPGVALNAHRGIAPTIVVGQAAGTAAALAVKAGVQPREVDLGQLQSALREDDVVLDAETVEFDFDIPEGKIRTSAP